MHEITKTIVENILSLFHYGLPAGLGSGAIGDMCMQHVVCSTYGQGGNDRPNCVLPKIRDMGVGLNDSRWTSNKARAEGLKRLAVAELGTSNWDLGMQREFAQRVRDNNIESHLTEAYGKMASPENDRFLSAIADKITEILVEMKSPGSEYLYLAEEVKE